MRSGFCEFCVPGFSVPSFRLSSIPAVHVLVQACWRAVWFVKKQSDREFFWTQTPVEDWCIKEQMFFNLLCVGCICFTSLVLQNCFAGVKFRAILGFCLSVVVAVESDICSANWIVERDEIGQVYPTEVFLNTATIRDELELTWTHIFQREKPRIALHFCGKVQTIKQEISRVQYFQINLLTVCFFAMWKWNWIILRRLIVIGVFARQKNCDYR